VFLFENGRREVFATTSCTVELKDDPGEADLIESWGGQAVGPLGVMDRQAWWYLLNCADLRVAPHLWRLINAEPGGHITDRVSAVVALGQIAHIDSVPKLIELLDDETLQIYVRHSLRVFGFNAREYGGFIHRPFKVGISQVATTNAERNQRIREHLPEWRRRAPELRKLLHQ
jgi:hypothetical protein